MKQVGTKGMKDKGVCFITETVTFIWQVDSLAFLVVGALVMNMCTYRLRCMHIHMHTYTNTQTT